MEKEDILQQYRKKKQEVDQRLEEFENLKDASDDRLFQELVFVILTSQSNARKCWEAAEELERRDLLMKGGEEDIENILTDHGIQYEREKARYIVENRKMLSQPTLKDPSGELKLSTRIDPDDLQTTREWLADNLQGIGMKGASHFLRNIGYGNSFAIISSHIMKAAESLGITGESSPPSNRKQYLKLEEKLQKLSQKLDIDVKALDLVLWSIETGEVFK